MDNSGDVDHQNERSRFQKRFNWGVHQLVGVALKNRDWITVFKLLPQLGKEMRELYSRGQTIHVSSKCIIDNASILSPNSSENTAADQTVQIEPPKTISMPIKWCFWHWESDQTGKLSARDFKAHLILSATHQYTAAELRLHLQNSFEEVLTFPTKLSGRCFYVFKKPVPPMWEHIYNHRGGQWQVVLPYHMDLSTSWELLLGLVADPSLEECHNELCGFGIVRLPKRIRLIIWNRNYDLKLKFELQDKLERMLKKLGYGKLRYSLHSDKKAMLGKPKQQ